MPHSILPHQKSQMKMTETIGVMFVFLVLVIFGFLFYTRFQAAGFQGIQAQEYEKRSIDVAQRTLNLPELQCSSNNIVTDVCLDTLKLDIFNKSIQSQAIQSDYYDVFASSTILVQEIYPDKHSWVIYNKKGNSTAISTMMPILLYDPGLKHYNFGFLNLTYYIIT